MIASPLLTNIKPENLKNLLSFRNPIGRLEAPGTRPLSNISKVNLTPSPRGRAARSTCKSFLPDIDFAVKNYKRDFDTLVKPKFAPSSAQYKKWKGFTDGAVNFVKQFRDVPGKNLILEIPGNRIPDEIVYVGAHYDTITHDHKTLQFNTTADAPGADDNASSVMALLAAARQFSQRKHDATIRFVLFDYEEIFFLGSYELAKQMSSMNLKWLHPTEKIVGLVNLEMIGWSQTEAKLAPVVKIYTRPKGSAELSGADSPLAQAFVYAVSASMASLKPQTIANGFDRSDNWSFWQWSFPAICVSEDWEKDFNEANYHTPHDLPSTLNYGYLKEVTLATIETISLLSRDQWKPTFIDSTVKPEERGVGP